MTKAKARGAPRLFDGRFTERRGASARTHIDELRELLDPRRHEERTAAADRRPGAAHGRRAD